MRKKENKGFSLLEVLVAIAVLGLLAGPLMHSFVTAANTNVKSKDRQRITAVAQNLMEQVVALEPEELQSDREWKAFDGAGNLIAVSGAGVAAGAKAASYVREYQNIVSGNRSYDARVTLSSNAYDQVNQEPLADISNMDLNQDACYLENQKDGQAASGDPVAEEFSNRVVTAMQDELQGQEITDDMIQDMTDRARASVEEKMKRTITLDVTLIGQLSGRHTTRVELSIAYEYNDPDDPDIPELEPEQQVIRTLVREQIFDNTGSEQDLRNIYLFYQPRYQFQAGGDLVNFHDTIIINNQPEVPVTVYLVKQKQGGAAVGLEQTYRVDLHVNERNFGYEGLPESDPKENWYTDDTFVAATRLRSNLGWDLYAGADPDKNPQVIPGNSQIDCTYLRFGRMETGDMREDSGGLDRVARIVSFSPLASTATRDHLFGVTVEVFEASEANRFGEEHKLYTMTGTKEN